MWCVVSWVGSVFQIPAIEFRRDRSLNRQIERRQLVGDRCVISDAEERNWRVRRPGVDDRGRCWLWSHTPSSFAHYIGFAHGQIILKFSENGSVQIGRVTPD